MVVLRVQASGLRTGEPQCETQGSDEVTISFSYSATATAPRENSTPLVVLNHAVISFKLSSESHMHVELTFTNDSDTKIAEKRTIYFPFDDGKGENHSARPFPPVFFT